MKTQIEHFIFLDKLSESGMAHMYRSPRHLKKEFKDISENDAFRIAYDWMTTLSKESPEIRIKKLEVQK